MTNDGNFLLPWPGTDDRAVIKEMLEDEQSEHWHRCYEFTQKLVQLQARALSPEDKEDIVQNVMMRIQRSLHTFQHECALRTWIFSIVRNCVIDFHRRRKRNGIPLTPLYDLREGAESEDDKASMGTFFSTEDNCLSRESLREALDALQEWIASTRSKAERNQQIIEMVIFQGHSLEHAAERVGCSAAVASYIVRTARSYVRKKQMLQE